ncbi:LamG domain-containing protein [Aliikangiella marina]|uniref:LamG domain-containing protein n=1 Tax=Aliikangiella marina TaxID=1712262 RepID=A0A545T6I0_9GAMM|nr:LamG domain-containing protein [Aliikangiella marina]TQV72831.1 LamG domain-containing protein [Aliikangiella marina]
MNKSTLAKSISSILIAIPLFSANVMTAHAAPGDILFSEDFETDLSQWTIDNSGGGDASLGTETANGGSSSLRLRHDTVLATSIIIDTNVPGAELTLWVQRGDDSFSENPDGNENLTIEYLNNSSVWTALETFLGSGTPGEELNLTYTLPSDALHANFQIRLNYAQGSGSDFDYWHIDDVAVTETDPSAISGLIGEWRFDELFWNGSANEVIDSSGNDLNLTAFSAQTSDSSPALPGDPGTCSYGVFNGSVSFIQLDDDTSTADSLLDIPNNLTITTWIYTNVIPSSGLKSILSKDENYEFHVNTSAEIFWWWGGGSRSLTTSGANITPGQWHHIAITFESGDQRIYVDGVQRGSTNWVGTLTLNNDPLQVGQDLDIPERFWDGFIDEVRIYENTLSQAEVITVMNETRPCVSSGVCTETFEDNFPAIAYDNSTGSQPWVTDWIEQDDDGSPSSGNVIVSGGELRMDDSPNSGGEPSIERELDLSSYFTAFITLDMSTSNTLENGDRFDIAVSDDGGLNYTILESFANDFNGTFNYDLSPYLSVNTRIRLRVENGYGASNERVDIDNIVITGQRLCGVDRFVIIHDGAGINCLREAITIRAEDSAGALVTDYSGTVNLSLSTNNGNWFTVDSSGVSADPATGTLTDTAGDNDGAATYQFNTSDGGVVTLYLEDTVAETTNIAVAEGSATDDNSEGDITFRPFGFVFSPSPIPTQIAGRPFDVVLTAAGQTPSQPACGVIEEYTGVKSLNFWSNYNLPTTSPTQVSINGNSIATTEGTSSGQNVTFTNGVATIAAQYDDVGEISFSAKDVSGIGEPPGGSGDEIIGGISPFVVRPFGYDIQVSGDPYANDGTAPVFTTAGGIFSLTISSVLWQNADDQIINATGLAGSDGIPDPFIDTNGDAIPDSGGDLSDNSVTPNISLISGTIGLTPTANVVTNRNGALSVNSVSLASFAAPGDPAQGSLTISQSWDEVGILTIDATTLGFMSTSENVNGQRINIGRFIPDNFLLTINTINEQCGSFTYGGFFDGVNAGLDRNGQPFTVSGNVTARNSSNGTTQNYQGVFAKLTNSDFAAQGYNVSAGANATGRVNLTPGALAFVSGTTSYSDANSDYQFDAIAAPFDLRIDLGVTDSDGVVSGTVNSNDFETRLGRMTLLDTYGPELSDLEMRVRAEYFDGTSWVRNTQDSCSTYIQTDASFDATSYTDNLSAGETTLFSPGTTQTLTNGQSDIANGLWFTAPGNNNFGSVTINLNLGAQPWLQFDWSGDNNLNPAAATLNFGYYRGRDRVIYWREL